ncbi:MAG: HAD family hydrolase [Deltaproteobacteria bacterium]|nr:HAD family hydrolase [Deltaproteobacteria bacterium]
MNAKLVFLDRDGVVLRAVVRQGLPYAPSPSEVELLPGVKEAVRRLRAAGYRMIVVTNQPDVKRGRLRREDVDWIHAWIKEQLPEIDEVRACFHDDDDHCNCRKPEPGMILQGRAGLMNRSRCFMVGDRWRDMEAGRRAGCTTIFVDQGYSEPAPAGFDRKVCSLMEACEWILSRSDP